ncbi:MAG: Druantia anti-phage system protein DruA, partial [Desulfoferrobacter sp.]
MSSESDSATSLTCSEAEIEQLKELASSTTAGIWRIKRAKALLGAIDGISAERLMYQVRVPVKSIVKCLKDFSYLRMAYFDRPDRPPTPREAAVEKMLALLDNPPSPSSDRWENFSLRYIGTYFNARQIRMIREMIANDPNPCRAGIARQMCSAFKLCGANGKPRLPAAMDILKRMAMDNLIFLSPQHSPRHFKFKTPPMVISAPEKTEETVSIKSLSPTFVIVREPEEVLLWNSIIHHYHYIPGHRLFGPQLRYLVYSRNGAREKSRPLADNLLAALSFSAPAWRVSCRDDYIGWNDEQRIANLQWIINNSRFLILPWIKVPNLASHILGALSRRAPQDWEARYGRRPVLLESFVECERFAGTCYKAANWAEVGTT